jgi:hypothetical protein
MPLYHALERDDQKQRVAIIGVPEEFGGKPADYAVRDSAGKALLCVHQYEL